MIELRYNKDEKLEYRTAITVGQYRGLYANSYAGELQWDEWKIVPSVEKEVVSPIHDGLRTEKIMLEITHCCMYPVAEWVLELIQDTCTDPGESVRVVDEDRPSVMDEDGDRIEMTWGELANFYQSERDVARMERDAAIRERDELRGKFNRCPECNGEGEHDSGGSAASGEWINLPCESCCSTGTMDGYIEATDKLRARVAELESAPVAESATTPPPARGWLTEEERDAVEFARSYYHAQTCGMNEDGGWYRLHKQRQLACESLLARSSPPEVEGLPEKLFWSIGEPEPHWPTVKAVNDVIDKCRAALAAAGVKVKEASND